MSVPCIVILISNILEHKIVWQIENIFKTFLILLVCQELCKQSILLRQSKAQNIRTMGLSLFLISP